MSQKLTHSHSKGMDMRMKHLALALALAVMSPATSYAASRHATHPVIFKNGTATIHGRIKGYEYVDYRFAAGAGESLRADLKTSNSANYFNLLAPGETDVAFFNGSMSDNRYAGEAPASGDYTARVYLMRSAARRGEKARYKLTITLGADSATNERGPDFADGLTGGPDYWEVWTGKANKIVAIRQAPSANASVLLEIRQGAILRNHGCKNSLGVKWCRVEIVGAQTNQGWIAGRYLRESAGPVH